MRYTHFLMVPEIGASRLNQTLKKDAQTMPFYVVFDNRENPTALWLYLLSTGKSQGNI